MRTNLAYTAVNRVRLSTLRATLQRVNVLEGAVSQLTDARLGTSALTLRQRLSRGERLDDLLPEAFALVREAARRQIGERHFDVQVIGAAALHRGWVAEMQTGEGKTLTATMPAFLNALTGRGVHVVTVNDYLAKRDAEWMGPIYRVLGLSVGCLVHGLNDEQRTAAYRADVTYGTNKEFAFDYLRDQLRLHAAKSKEVIGVFERWGRGSPLQREHNYAIVDEADSILVDEARVPLIISERESGESPYADAYRAARELALQLAEEQDFTVDTAARRLELTSFGLDRARGAIGVSPPPNRPFEHLVTQAMRAERLFQRDREYLVIDGKVAIVDEFTGRILPDRTWSIGLHQAIEAKEGVTITQENRTLASVTFQRYFRLYRKLAGMTGTAYEARREFRRIFGMRTVTIPTNRPLRRVHLPYRVFAGWDDKNEAIIKRINELRSLGRPVLAGTRSVHRSECLSTLLSERGIEHNVLNARNHSQEAAVIAEAGQPERVTISTNMAGRGVDIRLGNGIAQLGGLHVLGTELHEAGRIDRQLGGRTGRQGDPGTYEFFLCLEDEILFRWNRRLASRLLKRARRHDSKELGTFHLALFYIAQYWIERRCLRIRLDLVEYDKKLDEMKGNLGVPSWG